MKLALASLVFISVSASAVTAPLKKGFINLDGITTDFAKSIGIRGPLEVTLFAEVESATAKFKGYAQNVVCTEFGEEEIPSHPETAPCLKTETRWVPEVSISLVGVKASMRLGDKLVSANDLSSLKLADACILNLKDEIIVSEAKPMTNPVLQLAPGCSLYAYSRIEERGLKPSRLKGYSIEAFVDLGLNVSYRSAELLTLTSDQALALPVESVDIDTKSMFDFGGYRTKIFKYFDRVIFN